MLSATKKLNIIIGDIYGFNLASDLQFYNKGYVVVHAPETHRTQAQQRDIARAICGSVRKGIRFILMTNSDTMIKEFNTLIMFGRSDLSHLDKVRDEHGYGSDEYLKSKEVVLYEAKLDKNKDVVLFDKMVSYPKYGVEALLFDKTILDMQNVQDAIKFGMINDDNYWVL